VTQITPEESRMLDHLTHAQRLPIGLVQVGFPDFEDLTGPSFQERPCISRNLSWALP
jgi:hypothetical protein